MAKLLFRIGRWSFIHKWLVIIVWVVAFVGVGGTALTVQKGFNDVFAIDDMPSTQATELLQEHFPEMGDPAEESSVHVVFEAPEGQKLNDPKLMEAMDQTVASLKKNVPHLGDTLQLENPVTMNKGLQKELVKREVEMGLPVDTARLDAHTLRTYSDDGRYGTMSFTFDVPLPADVTKEDRQAVEDAAAISRDAGMTVEVGGPGYGDPIAIEPISEVAGLIVAFIILAVTFGSLLAAGMPLITAVIGIGIGSLIAVGATALVPLNSMTPTLGLMLGLAVGIDYALFIMSRYRDELRHGRSRLDAIGLATGTAGSAVVFAGLTVIIALVGLRVANIPFLSYMGYAAAANVTIAVFVALTFLPALLGAMGNRAFKKDANPASRESDKAVPVEQLKPSVGIRWAKLVHRVPGLMLALVMASLAALVYPALDLELALPSDKTANVDSTQRKSAEMLEAGFGAGRNAPMLVVVDATDVNPDAKALAAYAGAGGAAGEAGDAGDKAAGGKPGDGAAGDKPGEGAARGNGDKPSTAGNKGGGDKDAAGQNGDKPDAAAGKGGADKDAAAPTPQQTSFIYVADQLKQNADVLNAQIVGMSDSGQAAQVLLTPNGGPTEQETVQLIHSLRNQRDAIERATGVEIGITGLTPIQQDVTDKLAKAMPIYLALVVGLALVLLLMVFRSIAVTVMAVVGFLLSVAAAFGVTVLFWQKGIWGIWPSPGPLISFMPIFLIGVTFGLAMDYQVFIVSRMRERFLHDSAKMAPQSRYTAVEDSVIGGFSLGAKVVTAAALIMIGVFASFVFQPLPFIQIFGFALGAGVLFDAFFVRMTFIPAMMFLLGKVTWWMPKWLDKILPTVDVEGSALEEAFASGELGDSPVGGRADDATVGGSEVGGDGEAAGDDEVAGADDAADAAEDAGDAAAGDPGRADDAADTTDDAVEGGEAADAEPTAHTDTTGHQSDNSDETGGERGSGRHRLD